MALVRLAIFVALFFGAVGYGQEPVKEPPKSDAPKGPEDLIKDGLGEKFGAASVNSVERSRGQLRVRTNLPVVNDAIYEKVILETCRIIGGNSILYQDTKEIAIINRLQRQGYIYQAPGKCPSLLEAEESQFKPLLFADTRFCSRDCIGPN